MNVLILASSPLHLINSLLLSKTYPEWKINILFTGKFIDRNQCFADLLNSWQQSPFKKVLNYTVTNKIDASKLIAKTQPSLVITGNDLLPEFNILSQLCDSQNIEMAFMDDGLFSYFEYEKKRPSPTVHKLRNFTRKLLRRATKPYPFTIGNSPLTSATYLLYPEQRKPSLSDKKSYSLITSVKHPIYIEVLNAFAFHFYQKVELKRFQTNVFQLLIVPHHKRLNPEMLSKLKTSVSQFGKTVLKNHPSNSDIHILPLLDENCVEAPKEVPAELLLPLLKPQVITGGLSSIFLYSQALFPSIHLNILVNKDDNSELLVKKMIKKPITSNSQRR